jgi:hypothetical protein
MTASTTKPKSQAPLHAVKVTSVPADEKPANIGNNDDSSAKIVASQNKFQIEELVNKGLDLTETGIGLGVNIVERLGSIFKVQIFDKISSSETLNSMINNTSNRQPQAGQAYHPEEVHATTSEQTATPEQANYLINRLTLLPGGDVFLSFSINNDSMKAEKEIQLKIEPFVGKAQQYAIDASTFSITPSEIAIAPADFEKFIIKGHIPGDAPEDTYYGWIIVSEEQTYQIPVVLVVSKPHDKSTGQSASRTSEQRTDPMTATTEPQTLEE